MKSNAILMEDVYKRQRALSRPKYSGSFSHISEAVSNNRKIDKNVIYSLLGELSSYTLTESELQSCAIIIQKIGGYDSFSDVDKRKFMTIFTDDIMISSSTDSISRCLSENSSIGILFKQHILDKEALYEIYDKVIDNHNSISKRYHITDSYKSAQYLPVDEAAESVAELIDTYNTPLPAKVAISIQESLYLDHILGMNICNEDCIKYITEYFLNRDISDSDMSRIVSFLEHSPFLNKQLTSKLNYLFEPASVRESSEYPDSHDVEQIIDSYKAEQNKGWSKLKRAVERIYVKNPEAIIDGTPHILELIRNFGVIAGFAINPVVGLVYWCVDKYISMSMKRKDAERLVKYFQKEKDKVEKKIDKASGEKKESLEEYLKCLDQSLDKLKQYRDDLYSDAELDRRYSYDESASMSILECLSEDEYFSNIHKNIISPAVSRAYQSLLNEFVNRRVLEFKEYRYNDTESIVNVIKTLSPEDFKSNYITPDGMINIPLFMVYGNQEDILEIVSKANSILPDKCMVTNFDINDAVIITFNYLNKIAFDGCGIIDDDSEEDDSIPADFDTDKVEYILVIPEEIKEVAYELEVSENAIDTLSEINENDITSYLVKNVNCLLEDGSEDLCTLIRESSELIDINSIVTALREMKKDLEYYDTNYDKVDTVIESISDKPTELHMIDKIILQTEAVYTLNEAIKDAKTNPLQDKKKSPIIQSVEKVKKKNAEMRKEFKKKKLERKAARADKKAAITANLGLSLETLKKGMQNLSTKEKEISRSIDVSTSQLKKSIEASLTTNRREAIIKGSIIPSFSKCIKTGIAGIAVFNIFGPVVAAIGAVGALACSKVLNDRERQILLDEIQLELKVVDKELSRAESENRMKEYKRLLTYQRKLQREEQRIKYRLKVYGNGRRIPEVNKDGRD